MNPVLRKKRIWTVADFAVHIGWHFLRARRFLLKLNEKHQGRLLIPSNGTNRGWTFYPATLARLEPDLFAPIESIEVRLDEVEEGLGEVRADLRRTVLQTGANTRDIAKIRSRPPAV